MENNQLKKDTFIVKSRNEYDKILKLYEDEKRRIQEDLQRSTDDNNFKEGFEDQRNKQVEDEIKHIKEEHQKRLQEMLKKHMQDLEKLKVNSSNSSKFLDSLPRKMRKDPKQVQSSHRSSEILRCLFLAET